ncbi:mother-specific HO expression [Collariella sp. IMI 366227]|nr:mother-specific HO expression [Collariella sp. IMI 366227]
MTPRRSRPSLPPPRAPLTPPCPKTQQAEPTQQPPTQDGGIDNLLDPTPRTLRSRPSFADFDSTTLSPGTNETLAATEAHLSNGSWDNSVGKAGLGKTGRVINRLVSDNEALKRDIQIERLRAEESRQQARLLEDKLERVVSDYESRLLEASVTKTLLARKERQVETLQDAVDLERKRAVDAAGRERVWKDELEKTRAEAKRQVEEATNYAALCEGRYNAIASHWKDQGRREQEGMLQEAREVLDKLKWALNVKEKIEWAQ